jgi:hypothetical protein
MKKTLLFILSVSVVFSIFGCDKSQDKPAATAKSSVKQGPIIDIPSSAPGNGEVTERPQFNIVVPPEVKEQWTAVTIVVEDKIENKESSFTIGIGEEIKIDFKMSGTVITSASAEPNNPSVGIKIFEDDQLIFPPAGEWGWLYAKFPKIHSFQHDRYAFVLTAGNKVAIQQ